MSEKKRKWGVGVVRLSTTWKVFHNFHKILKRLFCVKDTMTMGRASEKVWIFLEKITRALLLQ